jgi:hypothetical protein
MKSCLIFFLLMLAIGRDVFCSSQTIICGDEPGEIYFVGTHRTLFGIPTLYYSPDAGATIERRYSVGNYGFMGELLKDAADSTIYNFRDGYDPLPGQYLTIDEGFNWCMIDTFYLHNIYTSGTIPGEIYRRMEDNLYRIERSVNFGIAFTPCTCNGYPDSLSIIHSIASGIDLGEVYIWAGGNLYYSNDYGENFSFLGDLYSTWGVLPSTHIINGAIPGEIFVFHHDFQWVWRIYNYGANAELILDLEYGINWFFGVAASRQPGELYFYALHSEGLPGGTMQIYHTLNYFQDWTMYTHEIGGEPVEDNWEHRIPSNISLQIYPNPTNAALSISYYLNTPDKIQMNLHNILGQIVWHYNAGLQSPGSYQLLFANSNLPSGKYFIQFVHSGSQTVTPITIIK